jgi:predicted heme/steroid binding protein
MKRIYFISMILIILVLILTGCTSSPNPEEDPSDEGDMLYLTLSELAEYDGKDGRPAYVAVDGVIYDVSNSRLWANGEHNGFQAGRDLTQEIQGSPHGPSTLSRMPKVGELID